jgi:predicted regulator of Ras-like GTPase activity (Roadblock/LC7/MglB family)
VISALEPLLGIPGVRDVMLLSHDGVPIAVPRRDRPTTPAPADGESMEFEPLGEHDQVAAITASWIAELAQTVGALSWERPRRVVLKGARGTLVLQATRSAVLLVILARGLSPEQVRLPMDGTIARIERSLRGMGKNKQSETPGPIPSTSAGISMDADLAEIADAGQRKEPSDS